MVRKLDQFLVVDKLKNTESLKATLNDYKTP